MAVIPVSDLRPGDKLYRSLVDFEILNHWGNYAGCDLRGRHWVFEHGKGGSCRLSLFDEFAQNYEVRFERIPDSDRPMAVSRMRELLENPRDYDVLGFNCQHASNYVAKGRMESGQVAIGLALVGMAVAAIVLKE